MAIGELYEHNAPRIQSEPIAAGPEPDAADRLIPAARSSAVLILVMLAFGCVVGGATGAGGLAALARTLVVSISPSNPAPTPVAQSGGGSSGSSSAGSPAPASTPAAAAPAPQQTITVPAATPPVPSGTTPSGVAPSLPPVKHVFEIVLSGQGYNQSFGTSQGHEYLSSTLRAQGELVANYLGVASSPLANEVAMISGQGPTQQTAANCPQFADITPATTGKSDQVLGSGCVYPFATKTLADQLTIAGLGWRAYVEGVGTGSGVPGATSSSSSTTTTSTSTTTSSSTTATSTTASPSTPATAPPANTCPHPALGSSDANHSVSPTSSYVTWRNPFVYFHSLLDGTACSSNDVGLDRLAADLKKASTTPAFSYIAPSPCDDGSDQPCAPGAPAGLAQADKFLHTVVPEIEASPAYKADGLIIITFDSAPQTGTNADLTSCCNQPSFPNLAAPGGGGTSTAPGTSSTTTTTSSSPTTTTSSSSTTTTSSSPTTTTSSSPTTTTSSGPTTTAAPAATTTTTTSSTGTSTTGPSCPATSGTTSSGPTTSTTTTTSSTTSTTGTNPNSGCPAPGTAPGGGQVGALLISRYVKPNSIDQVDTFNHFSLLKTVENLFQLGPLGYAQDPGLPVFDSAIFNAATP